jgi:cell wall-associated NlpC family hydrolase
VQAQSQEQAQSRFPDLNPAVAQAIEVLGTPYRWGGTDPLKGFDCSGLIQYVFGRLQVSVPRMPVDLFKKYNPVTAAQLLPGDVVFFNTFGALSHVGIYIGDRQFIHAPHKGLRVQIESLDSSYYKTRFAGARRVI